MVTYNENVIINAPYTLSLGGEAVISSPSSLFVGGKPYPFENYEDFLCMRTTDHSNYVIIKSQMITIPHEAPILTVDQGFWGLKDIDSLGFLSTTSKTELAFSSTYTDCVPTDIGKRIKVNGNRIDELVLAYYKNADKIWWLSGSTSRSASIPIGAQITIDNGTGAGTTSAAALVYGGGAIRIGHGFEGPTDVPKIILTDTEQGYNKLHIREANGTTPGHLDLGNLTAHGGVWAGYQGTHMGYLHFDHTWLGNFPTIGFNAYQTSVSETSHTYAPNHAPTTGGLLTIDCAGEGFTHNWYNWNGNNTPVEIANFINIWRADRNGLTLYCAPQSGGGNNGAVRLHCSANQVLQVQNTSGQLATLDASNLFVDHINSASGGGITFLDKLRGSLSITSPTAGEVQTFHMYATNGSVYDRSTFYMNQNAGWVQQRALSLWYYPGDNLGGCCHDMQNWGIDGNGNNIITIFGNTTIGGSLNCSGAITLGAANYLYFGGADTYLQRQSAGVIGVMNNGSLGTLNVSNLFADHINSATGQGIYIMDTLKPYGSAINVNGMLSSSGGVVGNGVAIGCAPFGSLSYPYESIQLQSYHNLRINFGSTEKFYFANSGTFQINNGNIQPASANVGNIGTNTLYWGSMWTNYLRYKNISSFDALDDLALAKNYRTMLIAEGNSEIEVVDPESLSFLKADSEEPFFDNGKTIGFLLGCVKALVQRVEVLESQFKSRTAA